MTAASKVKSVINGQLRRLGFELQRLNRSKGPSKVGIPGFYDKEFEPIHRRFADMSSVPMSGLYTAYQAALYVSRFGIKGDIVECGVFTGGASMTMLETLALHGDVGREVFLYDTYEGMSEPTEHDIGGFRTDGYTAVTTWNERKEKGLDAEDDGWMASSLEEVKANFRACTYPSERIHFVKGKVEDTIPKTMPGPIAILRLDTDWYESTRHELEQLFDHLVPSGVLIVDDYGAWKGSRKAVVDFFEGNKYKILLQPDAVYGAVVGIKQ